MVNASAFARGTRVSISRNSSGECALPPTGPTPQMVGAPVAAANPEVAQPPVNSAGSRRRQVRAARRVALEERLTGLALDQRQKLAGDLQRRAGAGHEAFVHDRLDLGQGVGAIRRRDEAQIDLAARPRRHRVDGLPARHHADIERDALVRLGQRVERQRLVRELVDRADALLEVRPECAALPVMSKRMNTPPLRPVTAAAGRAPGRS